MKKLIKNKRKVCWLSSAILGIGVISVATPLITVETHKTSLEVANESKQSNSLSSSTSSSNNSLYNGAIQYNGTWYNTVDDAATAYINKNPITQSKYIGDISSAYASRDLHTIDLNSDSIKAYDSTKLYKAYADSASSTGYTDSYQEALNATIPIYQRQIRYDDYSGKDLNLLPTDETTAKKNLVNNLSFAHAVPYYEVTDINGNVQDINPLNANDINRLKTIAANNVKDLGYGDTKNGFSKTQFYQLKDSDNNNTGIYVNADNFSAGSNKFSDVITNALSDFMLKVQVQPTIGFRTSDSSPAYSYQNNYTFKDANGNELGDTITGEKINLYTKDSDGTDLDLNTSELSKMDNVYDMFSTDFSSNFTVNNNAYSYYFMPITWHAGGEVTLASGANTSDLKDVFGSTYSIERKSSSNLVFYKLGINTSDYTFFHVNSAAPTIKSNYWRSSYGGVDNKITDNTVRQVYFQFQNNWYYDGTQLSNYTDLKNDFANYFGVTLGGDDSVISVDTSNTFYQQFKQDFDSTLVLGESSDSFNADNNPISYDATGIYGAIIASLYSQYFVNGLFSDEAVNTTSTYSTNPSNLTIFNDAYKLSKLTGIASAISPTNVENYCSAALASYVDKKITNQAVDVIEYNGMPLFMATDKSSEKGWLNVSNNLINYKGYSDSTAIDLSSNSTAWINYDDWESEFESQVKEDTGQTVANDDLATYLSGALASTNKNPDTTIKTSTSFSPGIFSALFYYDKNLSNYTNPTSTRFDGLEDKLTNRIDQEGTDNYNNFVILYSAANSSTTADTSTQNYYIDRLEEMHYGEYLGRLTDFNDGFVNINAFYNNSVDKTTIVANLNYYNPPQITYYVDKSGQVISLDPIEDDVNLSSQPTQSMYDSVDLVTTNATNNVIITPDTSVVYYEDGNQKILLKNNIEFLYSIKINNQTIVFDAYNYVFSYVKQYIIENGTVA